jgi:anti-sigma-K factor RskA
MIDEGTEERVALYALGLLSPSEAAQLEGMMRNDGELRQLVDSLQEASAALAYDAPPQVPPAHIRHRLLAEIRGERATGAAATESRRGGDWIPWAIAACLAIIAGMLFDERSQLTREIIALRNNDALSALRIATLSSQLQGTKALGAIAWNSQTQRGMVMLEKMPPLQPNQDYQLWVIDPQKPQPVSGGIVHVDGEGNARLTFTVEVPISNADKFAISRERTGGAPAPEGPIVMMSN